MKIKKGDVLLYQGELVVVDYVHDTDEDGMTLLKCENYNSNFEDEYFDLILPDDLPLLSEPTKFDLLLYGVE